MVKGKVAEFLYDFSSYINKEAESEIDLGISVPKTLSDSIRYMNDVQHIYTDSLIGFTTNGELADKKVRQIAQKLACALDNNSTEEVKNLKSQYGDTPEFLKAKKLLNEKCKTVWSVYEINNENIPHEAMKTLGISNIPSLDFLLGNTIKYFEKDNCQTTIRTIEFILNNKNLNYTIDDIHKYLHNKNVKLNYNTVRYLVEKHSYDIKKLQELRADKSVIKEALHNLEFKTSAQYHIKNITQALYEAVKNLKTA